MKKNDRNRYNWQLRSILATGLTVGWEKFDFSHWELLSWIIVTRKNWWCWLETSWPLAIFMQSTLKRILNRKKYWILKVSSSISVILTPRTVWDVTTLSAQTWDSMPMFLSGYPPENHLHSARIQQVLNRKLMVTTWIPQVSPGGYKVHTLHECFILWNQRPTIQHLMTFWLHFEICCSYNGNWRLETWNFIILGGILVQVVCQSRQVLALSGKWFFWIEFQIRFTHSSGLQSQLSSLKQEFCNTVDESGWETWSSKCTQNLNRTVDDHEYINELRLYTYWSILSAIAINIHSPESTVIST